MTAEVIAEALGLKRSGHTWRGPCPLHGGTSFTLSEGRDGRPLWTCWSGCDRADILEELRSRGLWARSPSLAQRPVAVQQQVRVHARALEVSRLWAMALEAELERVKAAEARRGTTIGWQKASRKLFLLQSASASKRLEEWCFQARRQDHQRWKALVRAGSASEARAHNLCRRIVLWLRDAWAAEEKERAEEPCR